MINTSPKKVHFLNQNNGEIPRICVIDPETINPHEFCYECSKHGPDFCLGKLLIKDFNDEPHFPSNNTLISGRIEINMLFNTKDEIKRKTRDWKIHKAVRIPVDIHGRNKTFTVTVKPKSACRLEFVDHLWIPFLYQP